LQWSPGRWPFGISEDRTRITLLSSSSFQDSSITIQSNIFVKSEFISESCGYQFALSKKHQKSIDDAMICLVLTQMTSRFRSIFVDISVFAILCPISLNLWALVIAIQWFTDRWSDLTSRGRIMNRWGQQSNHCDTRYAFVLWCIWLLMKIMDLTGYLSDHRASFEGFRYSIHQRISDFSMVNWHFFCRSCAVCYNLPTNISFSINWWPIEDRSFKFFNPANIVQSSKIIRLSWNSRFQISKVSCPFYLIQLPNSNQRWIEMLTSTMNPEMRFNFSICILKDDCLSTSRQNKSLTFSRYISIHRFCLNSSIPPKNEFIFDLKFISKSISALSNLIVCRDPLISQDGQG
jgi:hypothetical protein